MVKYYVMEDGIVVVVVYLFWVKISIIMDIFVQKDVDRIKRRDYYVKYDGRIGIYCNELKKMEYFTKILFK